MHKGNPTYEFIMLILINCVFTLTFPLIDIITISGNLYICHMLCVINQTHSLSYYFKKVLKPCHFVLDSNLLILVRLYFID